MTRNARNRVLPISAMKPQTVKAISYPHNDFRDSQRPEAMPDKPNVVSHYNNFLTYLHKINAFV